MASHLTYLTPFFSAPEAEKYAAGIALGLGLVLIGRSLTSRLCTAAGLSSAVIPADRLSLFGFFDVFIEGFIKFHDSVLGKENRRFLPFVGTIFLFILTSNLLGLIPGMPAITTVVWVNVAMSLVVFGYFNYQGVKAHGVFGYLKHFYGPIWWFPLLFPIEIAGAFLRILTLNLRLYWNITADHIVLEQFTEMAPYIVPIVFYVLGTFVCFMQAFIFTMLTMVYILLATQHEEEAHH